MMANYLSTYLLFLSVHQPHLHYSLSNNMIIVCKKRKEKDFNINLSFPDEKQLLMAIVREACGSMCWNSISKTSANTEHVVLLYEVAQPSRLKCPPKIAISSVLLDRLQIDYIPNSTRDIRLDF